MTCGDVGQQRGQSSKGIDLSRAAAYGYPTWGGSVAGSVPPVEQEPDDSMSLAAMRTYLA